MQDECIPHGNLYTCRVHNCVLCVDTVTAHKTSAVPYNKLNFALVIITLQQLGHNPAMPYKFNFALVITLSQLCDKVNIV